jgi:hypothetical protein
MSSWKYFKRDYDSAKGCVGFMFLGGYPKVGSENFSKWVEFLKNQTYKCLLISHPIEDTLRSDSQVPIINKFLEEIIPDQYEKVEEVYESKKEFRFKPFICRNWTETSWGDPSLVRATLMMMEDLKEADYLFLVDSNSRPLKSDDLNDKIYTLVKNNKNLIRDGSQWVGLTKELTNKFFDDFTLNDDEGYPKSMLQSKKPLDPKSQKIVDNVNGDARGEHVISGVLDEAFFQHIYLYYYRGLNNLQTNIFDMKSDYILSDISLERFKIYRTFGTYDNPGLRTGGFYVSDEDQLAEAMDNLLVKNMYEYSINAKRKIKLASESMGSSPMYTDWAHVQPTGRNLFRENLKGRNLERAIDYLDKVINAVSKMCEEKRVQYDQPYDTFNQIFKSFVHHPLEFVNNTSYDRCPVTNDKSKCRKKLEQLYENIVDCSGKLLLKYNIEDYQTPLLVLLHIRNQKFEGLTLDKVPEIIDIAEETGHFFIRKVIGDQSDQPPVDILGSSIDILEPVKTGFERD